MKNTLEYPVNLTVANGSNNNEVDFKPINGRIVGCAIFTNVDPATVNPGIVNAAILDTNNSEVSRMQHIGNYRSREAEYMKGFKPLFLEASGQSMTFQIQATANMTGALQTQLILYYEIPAECRINQ